MNAIRKVTVEDVSGWRKYLDLDRSIAAVLTPQPSGNPVSGRDSGARNPSPPSRSSLYGFGLG